MRRAAHLVVLWLVLACPLAWAGDAPTLSGYLVDDQGQKIQVAAFLNLLPRYPCVYEDSEMSIPMKDIKSLTRLEGGRVRVETRDGKSLVVVGEMGISYTTMLPYRFRNPLTGKLEEGEIDPVLVQRIVFR